MTTILWRGSACAIGLLVAGLVGPTAEIGVLAQPPGQPAAAHWDGFRNRLLPDPLPRVVQDFGHRKTNFAGGRSTGEIGGQIQRSTVPARYVMPIPLGSLEQPHRASGKLTVRGAEGGSGAMFGWCHEDSRGWRTPNSLAVRIDGNGGKYWVFYEYGTCNWLTGGGGAFEGDRYQTTPTAPFAADGTSHDWVLDYHPDDGNEPGTLTLAIDDRRYEIAVPSEHRRDGATFNRFGIWNVQIAGAPLEMYLDDLVVDGEELPFDDDPHWIQQGNRIEFGDRVIRPLHDFGLAADNGVLGEDAIGGIVFRDERPSYFGQVIEPATLDKPLAASGRLALASAASDSGIYLGWFHAEMKRTNETTEYQARQPNILALLVEGPSRVGHYVRPAFSGADRRGHTADGSEGWPIVRPDGRTHDWKLVYTPAAGNHGGTIRLTFDRAEHSMEISREERAAGATFDRFGLFNLQAGGHQVEIYVDRLELGSVD